MEKQILIDLLENGKTQQEISDFLGKSQTTIRYWLKKHNLSTQDYRQGFNCKFCGETDPNRFMKHDKDRTSRSRCKACHSRYTTQRFRNSKLRAIEYKGGKCVRCGYDKCPGSLHFHHDDPAQKDPNWRLMRSWLFDNIIEELDKCSLVCANCHGEIHWGSL